MYKSTSCKIYPALILSAFLIILGSCVPKYGRGESSVPECEITRPLDSLYSSYIADDEPGAIVAVMRGDTIKYCRPYGLARLDSIQEVNDSTIFNASSVTKIVTGVAIMKLVEQGLISLDDSLSRFFPEFPSRYFDKITVRHVLNHTSGLPDLRPQSREEWNEYLEDHRSIYGYDTDYRLYGTEREYMQTFENLDTIAYQPGEHYDFHDISYILISPLVRRVTGTPFAKWMRTNIFDPAGMTRTFYYLPGLRVPNMAHGYRPANPAEEPITFRSRDGKWDEYDYQEAEYFLTKADRGFFTTVQDFMNFKRALSEGRLISQESINTLLEPTVDLDRGNVYYGVTTWVAFAPDGTRKGYHNHCNGGFGVIEGWWPDVDVHYIVFMARNDLPRAQLIAATDSIIASAGWLRR